MSMNMYFPNSRTRQRKIESLEVCPESPDGGHYFILPQPSGEIDTVGVCKYCSAERVHQNVLPYLIRQEDTYERKRSAGFSSKFRDIKS